MEIQGTQMNIQVTEMLVEAIWLEFKMQLAEIEA
jgi:hypothetical protein